MSKKFLLLLIFGLIQIGQQSFGYDIQSVREEENRNIGIFQQCWQEFSPTGSNYNNNNDTDEFVKIFQNYNNWTEEEVPCLARCIAGEKGWFDVEAHRWNKQKIVDDLGANLYNYCRYELSRPFKNVCAFAFKGLKCLKQAELNVIVTYNHLVECVKEKATSMSQLLEYYHFPDGERIPCLFHCFAQKSQLYKTNTHSTHTSRSDSSTKPNNNNNHNYEWNVKNWLKAFGPIRDENVNLAICRVSDISRKSMDVCAWMYEEYNCWERLNYNTNGSVAYRRAAFKKIVSGRRNQKK